MAVVHHSNHARYLERGRIEFLRLAGLDYVSLMNRGMQYPVLELNCVFKKPLVFDQVILLETEIASVSRTRLSFSYKIFPVNELAQPLLTLTPFAGIPSVLAETSHCCVNLQGRPVAADADVSARLMKLYGGHNDHH